MNHKTYNLDAGGPCTELLNQPENPSLPKLAVSLQYFNEKVEFSIPISRTGRNKTRNNFYILYGSVY